ncbi:glycoside hydrolase family 95-like protein [Nonomuraea angiospora]|uniref:Alpha fucosidase A-like C-terminal domain-containing protein n=1 Tax=Nonomuraea angiospora TaxID=46172 RepID=A0ABR9MCN1_9ACTN|nr:hypothetical protein [Nonomuraea angiospora]MBE1590262.1 hypothetical protein [Nonomuraea angiospora]
MTTRRTRIGTCPTCSACIPGGRSPIHVLPALPSAWPTGSVRGLRARGDVTVDVSWRDGAAERITLHAGRSGPITVRTDLAGRCRVSGDARPRRSGDTLSWDAEAGTTYTILGG